jgi:hypothetical protein
MAVVTSAQISASLVRSPSPPPAGSNRPSTTCAAKPGMFPLSLMCTSLARSCSPSTGNGSTTWRHDAGPGSSRFCSGPVVVLSEVTSSSRIASSGGLVTCANSWVK